MPVNIDYIDMPNDLRKKYQYHTQADMTKWKKEGLNLPSIQLESGISDYIRHYLNPGKFL
jgi:ADP-L-glycero-D-manno-heptose 6-epimerase